MNHPYAKLLLSIATGCLLIGAIGCNVSVTPQNDNEPALLDTDRDGIPDISDPDIDGDGILNTNDPDIDGDGTPNIQDTDLDGDGVTNINDNDLDGDGVVNPADPDIDGDGVPNIQDPDIDGDGVANIDDNDIDGDGVINTTDNDIDGDGVPNIQDTDLDGDGVANGSDIDLDGDGVVNSQDPDIDGDGAANVDDPLPDGTGDGSSGTQGSSNTGTDANGGTANSGPDQNTGDNSTTAPDVSGIVVNASQSSSLTLDIIDYHAGDSASAQEVIELADVRQEVENNDIDLPSAYITKATVTPTTESAAYIAANSNVHCVLKIYYQRPGRPESRILMMQTPENGSAVGEAISLGNLQSSISLNHGLYVVMPGYADYVNIIKNESVDSVEMVGEVEFLDDLSGAGEITLDVNIEIAGKKKI